MVYVQAQIKLHPGKQTEFVSLLNTLMPLLNKHGWKLIGSYSAMVGRFNTVLDLWELPNPNAVESLLSDPAFAKYAPTIHEIVEDEVLTVMSKLPIG
jgi:hypothetical protein